ncbi:hypothetical protein [Actinacidiphila oryziradicis]|uniref:Uncharacterized protein n=1 Tax=Actinacidiphila oryziradicis TaxID=2571141 RepID=A0A4U0RSJ4_9ACTN|nr:hypothetical protein [Actinacidiphila oryziradicis]TJZ99045.1 hypothetical protein FCI23_47165 [Actinacidiphila oryziradicis]
MKRDTPEYEAALDAMVLILQRWAQEGRTDGWYSALSAELKADDHPVHHRGRTMSELLEDACRRGNGSGQEPMLSAIVINKHSKKPSGQFFELAKGHPFYRTDPDWTWVDERDRVFGRRQN